MRAVIFLAEGFEEIEAITVIDVLRRAEIEVVVVGISSLYITGAHGITVKCDCDENDFRFGKDVKIVILPGGMPGTINLQKSSVLQNAINSAVENNIYIGAICAAPIILGQLGLLKSKNAVCYPGFEDELLGANICNEKVCLDDKFVTAKGPGAAVDFAFKIVEVLTNVNHMEVIKNDMIY